MWLKIALALKNDHGDQYRVVWTTLSRLSPKFDLTEANRLWESLDVGTYAGARVTLKTVEMWAREDDPAGYAAYRACTLPPVVLEKCTIISRGLEETLLDLETLFNAKKREIMVSVASDPSKSLKAVVKATKDIKSAYHHVLVDIKYQIIELKKMKLSPDDLAPKVQELYNKCVAQLATIHKRINDASYAGLGKTAQLVASNLYDSLGITVKRAPEEALTA
jgi:hypothetical protein